ncbi:MAG: TerD family protein [Oscillospiraceae bacterium]
MADTINEIISRTPAGGTAVLPSGEFEGPVYITKPLKLVGNNTTIWAKRGCIIDIGCAGAAIEGLRVELTEGDLCDVAIAAHFPVSVSNVELLGQCRGFGAEDALFDFPRTLELGSFAADSTNTYILEVFVPCDAQVVCRTNGLSFSPSQLTAGRNRVSVTVSGFSTMNYLFAEVLIKSLFTRRVYVSGRPSADIQPVCDKLLYTAAQNSVAREQVLQPAPDVISVAASAPPGELPLLELRKGQRVALQQYVGTRCELRFSGIHSPDIEIDPYIFLLGSDEKCLGESGMVFFGNASSSCGEVVYDPGSGVITFDFDKMDSRVQRIAIAYSIYDGSASRNFSRVGSPAVTIRARGEDRISYCMYGLNGEVTIVAAEIYLYKGEWKISAVGRGYRDGLVKLCNNYGIEVTD